MWLFYDLYYHLWQNWIHLRYSFMIPQKLVTQEVNEVQRVFRVTFESYQCVILDPNRTFVHLTVLPSYSNLIEAKYVDFWLIHWAFVYDYFIPLPDLHPIRSLLYENWYLIVVAVDSQAFNFELLEKASW